MKPNKWNSFVLFHNGSIGDFLMALHFMENIHLNVSSSKLIIAVPRNAKLCQGLAEGYPYIGVLEVNKRPAPLKLLSLLRAKTCVITPATPGHLPLFTKLYARLVAIAPGSLLVGFDDKKLFNRFFYDLLVPFSTDKLYYQMLESLITALGFSIKIETPILKLSSEVSSEGVLENLGLSSEGYIVLHPFGSSSNRSILGGELIWLIDEIARLVPDSMVVISGSVSDRENIPKELEGRKNIRIITGDLTMQELALVIVSSKFLIGVDTGITHLACVLHHPVLAIAHNGAAHWLPYYNEKATILYAVRDDVSGVYEGQEHLQRMRQGRTYYLTRVPQEVIGQYFRKVLA